MVANLNMRFEVIRFVEQTDDYAGGAMMSGTSVYRDVMGRMSADPTEQVFLAQGMEVDRTFKIILIPGTLDIRERDEVQVSQPHDHQYYGDRFRILSMSHGSTNPRDRRDYLVLDVSRSVRAHRQQ